MKPCRHPLCPDTGPCKKVRATKKRKPIPRFSKKRSRENRKYSTLRKQFLSDNPECMAELEECTGVATEVHHSRGRIGENLLNVGTWKAVCRTCHRAIEERPAMAKELGLSISRLRN